VGGAVRLGSGRGGAGALARHLPSAGGFYTYVAHGIGPRWGFITGWLYALMVTVVPAALAAFTGAVLHDELDSKYGSGLPWWVYALVILAICFACAYRGIVISVRFLVVMSMFEIAVGLGLSLTGVANPGPGGVNGTGFNPAHIGSSSGFFLAIVLSIFAFTGFESAAAVGEESRNPKRLVPIAIAGSLTLIGAFYVVCAWGLQIGWGTDNLSALANSPTAPEVAGEQPVRLSAQERPPGGVHIARGRPRRRPRRIRRTVASLMWCPSRDSSPWTLRYPQAGFSRASRSTRSRISWLVPGRPGRFG
jgi:amino acid transporter